MLLRRSVGATSSGGFCIVNPCAEMRATIGEDDLGKMASSSSSVRERQTSRRQSLRPH